MEESLPDDLLEALVAKRPNDTVYGTFVYRDLSDVKMPIFVRSNNPRELTIRMDRRNPDKYLAGIYCCFAIAPLQAPPDADIDGIPVWLPGLGRYGCWNADTLELYLYFEWTTWSEIERDPHDFISFKWRGEDNFINILRLNKLYEYFDFVYDDLSLVLGEIDAMPRSEREEYLTITTNQISSILARYPFSLALSETYPLLCEMYQKMGHVTYKASGEPDQREFALNVIKWNEQCLWVIDLYRKEGLKIPLSMTNIFVVLILWYIDLGDYDTAIKYAEQCRTIAQDGEITFKEMIHYIDTMKKLSLSC